MKKISFLGGVLTLACAAVAAPFTVDDKVPAGNVVVEGIDGDVVRLKPDLRDTDGDWFYWAFRVCNAAGRTLNFRFGGAYGGNVVGTRGPVVSCDKGKTWRYPLDGKSRQNTFTYTFPTDADEVWFYECHPYHQADWDAFLVRHAALRGRFFETGVLCQSKKGRAVEKARFGCLEKPKFTVVLTARHHASESVASYALEGFLAAVLADDDLGAWLRANVQVLAVPFMDKDGCVEGDQGKNRKPHDHNRDYGAFIHPETKATVAWIKDETNGKIDMWLDLHCPWIRGHYNECVYSPLKRDVNNRNAAAERRFSALLEKLQCGSLTYKASDDLPYGKAWNTDANYTKGMGVINWAIRNLPEIKLGHTLEIPFATANGAVVTPDKVRDLGRDLAKALRAFLTDDASEPIVLEAEAFRDWGGWVNDTQFMDQMGSPYLLAHGMGKRVADATTTFEAKGGEYHVYVRTKNWAAPWYKGYTNQAYAMPGLFRISLNGERRRAPILAGHEGNGEWNWVHYSKTTLRDGKNNIRLCDHDGFDGRCDAIIFSRSTMTPEALDKVRTDFIARKPVTKADYDFVVVGGGIAGICSAVSAARLGLKTALIQDRPILGGNNSSEVRVHLGAWQNVPPYPRLGDLLAEIAPAKGGNAQPKATYEDDRKLKVVLAEKNLDLFLNERVNGVQTNAAGAIVSVTSQNTRTGAKRVFAAKWFADCTGDGTVGFLAGADWRMGREARSAHGEPWAPEKADNLTMGASVQWYAGDAKGEAAFPLKPWMIRFTDANGSTHLRGDWYWEAGLGRDQIAEAEYIRDYGLLVAYSNWAYAKNVATKKNALAGKELKWVAYNAGRRESRRLMGDFILTENDLMNKNFQSDGTCATTWTIDLHLPKSAADSKFDGEPFQSDSLNHVIWPYPVPYRCYYSRNVPNLFMAGRNISVTHVALGTTRLMRTHGMMGEVVGMAASLCKKHACHPRGIYTKHLDELKSLMKKGVGDGKKHPPQLYNLQSSLDPSLKPSS